MNSFTAPQTSDAVPSGTTPLAPSPFPSQVRTVGVCFPAGLPADELVVAGCRQLKAWGLEPLFVPLRRPGTMPPFRYLSASDDDRAHELLSSLENPDVDVILVGRGGFGCSRLFPRLSAAALAQHPKPIIGYSDITALHALSFSAGLAVNLSGPMLAVEFARLAQLELTGGCPDPGLLFSLASLRAAWTPVDTVALPLGTPLTVCQPGEVQGRLFPATLTVLASLLGTAYTPDLTGAILVLEDVNEPSYRLDRCLNQLRQAGVLRRLGGLIWGSFTGTEDPEWLADLFREYSAEVHGPVVSGLPYGHAAPSVTVPVGRMGTLRTNRNSVLKLAW